MYAKGQQMIDSQLCGARTRSGGACKRHPGPGLTRCKFHGGASPLALAKAEERLAEARARKTLASLGEPVEPVTDAVAALESLAGQCVALTSILRSAVGDLESIRYTSTQGFEQVRGELTAYISLLARTESVLAKIVALDLDSRRLALDQAKILAIVGALEAVLSHRDLALDPERQRRGRELLARRLGAPQLVSNVLARPTNLPADLDRSDEHLTRDQALGTELVER